MASLLALGDRSLAIHGSVWHWAQETPFSIAVTDRGRNLSYRELAGRADALARRLVSLGVRSEVLVAISAQRSAAFVIAVLGVLRAGGAYVPIDPSYPAERRSYLLQDSQCSLLVTESSLQALYGDCLAPQVLLDSYVDAPLDDLLATSPPAGDGGTATADPLPPIGLADDSLAYVIYTSGSTGKPKGVCVTQHNLLRLFRQTEGWFGFQASDVWTLFHSFSFDFSVWEMWGALLYGGRLVMVPTEQTRDPLAFYALVQRERVTVLNQTPSEFRLFLRADALPAIAPTGPGDASQALALRYVMLGGEALDLRTLRPWFARHGDAHPQLFNLYGITETSVIITYRPLRGSDVDETRSLIGVPIPDLRLHVLDASQAPVAAGGEGELWVGGAGVARGYLRRPALTAERFRSLPQLQEWGGGAEERLYRTGDAVRQHPDGELEFLGRIDQQVKVRGHRIELGEVEAVLRAATGVSDAAVVVREAESAVTLAAYVVARDGQTIDLVGLRAQLQAQLPAYMCPTSLQEVARIPLTVNGKIDHAALPPPPLAASANPDALTARDHSASERSLAALFARTLGCAIESVEADFFALGGTSLQAMRLSLEIAETLGATLPPGTIFQHSTVRGLAARIDALRPIREPAADAPVAVADTEWQTLSAIQAQMWFVQSLSPASPAFLCPVAFRIRGELDLGRLRGALLAAGRRHPLLRARFALHAGQPQQQIAAEPTFDLQRVDAVPGEPVADQLTSLARRPLDLSHSAGAAWLIRESDQEHLLLLVLHHLVTDGWSLHSLLHEIAAAYNQTPVPPPRTSYFQHLQALQRPAQSGSLAAAESYFVADLAGAPPSSELPNAWPRPRTPSLRGALVPFTLPASARPAMARLMQSEGTTASVLLFSSLFALLHRYSGQHDLVIGLPYAGRDTPGSGTLQGPLLNLLPIRVTLPEPSAREATATFRSLVQRVRSKTQGAYGHSALPFSRVRQLLGGPRDASRHPLFQIAFSPQPSGRAGLVLQGLEVQTLPIDPGKSPYDLTLYAWPDADGAMRGDGGLYCELEYSTDLFAAEQIARLIDHFQRLLVAGCDAPDCPLFELPMLSEVERRELLQVWSGRAAAPIAQATPLRLPIERFAAQVQATPHADAIRCGPQTVSYAQLDRWSQRIAAALIARGVARETRVALACPRSPAAIAGILGVWRAGAAYVPLDPSYPEARLEFMLRDSGAMLLLTVPESADLFGRELARLDLSVLLPDTEIAGAPLPVPDPTGDALAYVIYTSGSTGQPKGVLIEQHSLSALADAIPQAFPLSPGGRLLQFASLSFDWSVAEVLIALTQGGTLVIPPQRTPLAGPELLEFLAQQEIQQVLLPPSVLSQLPQSPPPTLDLLLVGGEHCPADLVERFAPGRRFRNCYGPTEATIVATVHDCQPAELAAHPDATTAPLEPAIGRPLPGAEVYVLDATGRLVPPLVAGELYIAGRGLARGYHARPDLTAERFPPALPDVAQRLYRSGDRARFRLDGTLEFLGRRDGQRKVRGFRIELGEIEHALRGHAEVQSAAVIVDGEGASARLLAYVVRRESSGEAPRPPAEAELLAELRTRLRTALPPQLIPAELILLSALPLSPNGKLDVAALPKHAESSPEGLAAQTEWEALVAEIWTAVLGRPVPRTANFFDVGGSSLRLIEVQACLEAKLGTRIPLADLFAHPTIEAMAVLISGGRPSATGTQRSAAERAARAQAQQPRGRRGR